MKILFDCVEYQASKAGFKSNRKLTASIKDDTAALQELTELLRAIIYEANSRDLPLDQAFTELHIAEISKRKPNYKEILDKHRKAEPNTLLLQRENRTNIARKIHDEHKKELEKLHARIRELQNVEKS